MTVSRETLPYSPAAEESVVGGVLARPAIVQDIIATGLEPIHFYGAPMRALFHEAVQCYYADQPIDPLTFAEILAKPLSRSWACDDDEVVTRVRALAGAARGAPPRQPVDHAQLVKRHADYRALLETAAMIVTEVERENQSPEEIAGLVSVGAMEVATSSSLMSTIVSFDDLGRNFIHTQRTLMAARAAGVELGVYFGLPFLDAFTRGLRPSELLFIAGEPGVGKSAVTWAAALSFATKQMQRPEDKRIATLVLSLEMAEEPSSGRLAQGVTGLDGGKLREGRATQEDLRRVAAEWRNRKGLPLYFSFGSNLRASQVRAIVADAIRRHNVGLVIIDHFKYLDMDGRWRSQIEEDGAKARFLKQDIATQLNVACICLAHTTKAMENKDRRPRLEHLRGSQEISAHADFVSFIYRPYNHATESEIDAGKVLRTDAEMIFAKNRHALEGSAQFFFDPSRMEIH
jgi:replicative DNA helicase